MRTKMAVGDINQQCMNRLNIGPVHGSDLIPLKRIYQPNMTSYNKKRERRERHIKQMLKQRVREESGLSGMTSALFELAVNSTDIIDFTLVELWRQNRPKPVEPIDYETYVLKNKVLLHNDPHRELLMFPHDDVQIPAPTPAKKIRTIHSTVPKLSNEKSGNLLVDECLRTYTDTCHMVQFKYSKYSGGYQQLPNIRKPTSLPDQVFEIDTEMDERDIEDSLSRSYSNASVAQTQITKAGWLYKGPDSGKDTVISFTRQFKRRYFCIKQQADQTYSLEFFKDDKKSEAKGVIFLDCAQEVVKNSKKGKHCFEVRMPDKAYVFAAESEAEMEDWIKTLDKVRTAAETLSQVSLERGRDEIFSPGKIDDKAIENMVHPELTKYAKESESMMQKARQEGRQNLFNVYSNMARYIDDDEEEEIGPEVDVYPKQFGERFMLRLLDFRLKLQVNLAEEGHGNKHCNPEPFYLTFTLYDAKDGRKISEDFHMDLNEAEIEKMIPADVMSASDRLHTVEGKSTSPELNGLDEKWLLSKQKQGVFSVIRRHSEIYLYVKIEKVLQGPISQSVEPYLKGSDPKTGSKVYRQMKQFCSHIGHHRMPFAWSARPLATSSHGPCEMPIYKQESSKMSEEEIIKHLQDLRRPEKQSKWQTIPGVLKISLHPIKADQPLENTVTSSYVPVKPFPSPPTNPPAVEIEEFIPEKGQFNNPHNSYVNNLYVYPISLKYDSQKSFTKARNIACCVEIRESDDDHVVPLKSIYGTNGPSVFTSVASTTVLHHNQTPEYLEEVKIALPPLIHEKHHILFRFYHVSCEGSKGSTKKRDGIEMPVGYAWIPLLHSTGRVEVGEKTLPVAANLPVRYLSLDHHGAGRTSSSADVKMVDSGKPVFKIKLQLNSTIYTTDQHLHTFFFHCQKMLGSASPGPDSLNKLKVFEKVANVADTVEQTYVLNAVKSLHAVDVSTYIQFLPTILNMLFKLVANTQSEDISMNAVRVVIHIVSEVQDAEKLEMLEKYVKYIFRAEHIPRGSKHKTVHEELAKSLTMILRPANADQVVVTKFLNNSWFFFEVLIKSMTQYLIDGERVKMPRNERFSSDYQYKLQTLIQTITPYITSKYKEAARECRNANFSLAYFVKMCFTLMDRGVVFQLISHHLLSFAVVEHRILHEFKFEFLRIISSHEHYIPLSLPLMRRGLIKTYKDSSKIDQPEIKVQPEDGLYISSHDLKCDYTLSEEYRKTHYLPGMILQELKMALNESKETRRCAINVLRDQFAKHAFDDRYTKPALQGRIAALYLPLISVLLENKHRLIKSDEKSPAHVPPSKPSSVVNGDISSGKSESKPSSVSGHTPQTKHRSVISMPQPTEPSKRDSSVFDMIAGTKIPYGKGRIHHSHLGVEDLKSKVTRGSSTSLASSASSTDTKTDTSREKDKGHSRQSSITTLIPGATPASPKVYQYQKLDVTEIKDLLVCFLHILRYLPDDILLGWFNNSSEYDIVDFFSLLELCLDHFKYLGRKKIVTLSVIGDSSMGRKGHSLPSHRKSAQVPVPNGSLPPTLRSVSQYGDYPPEAMFHMTTSSEADAMMRALSEANMATETGLIVLDVLVVYTEKFKSELAHRDGDNTLMLTVFDLYLSFLKTSQSETLQKHVFAVLRSFIRKFPNVLFKGDASLCGKLCYEVLKCCNCRLKSTRKEACILLYNLMKANFEFSKKKSFTRVHLQVIISVAQLIGNVVTLSNHRFQESLALINSYANSDKTMNVSYVFHMFEQQLPMYGYEKTKFSHEVKDLTKRIKTVMMATAQMKEHERDPEMLIDLQYSLANSYASTPELRKTWLESMARIHTRNNNHSEAAHCYIHIAALVAEYLKKRGKIKSSSFPQGCTAFKLISPNVEKEESGIKDDSGMQDVQYTEETLVTYMEEAVECLEKAERFEVLGDVYKLIIPMYERAREFEKLAQSYQILADAYSKVVEVMQSGRRLLGTYFRVAFFGQSFFEEEDQKQYIYKEPKVTSLAELCDRLKTMYEGKYGKDNVKLIKDSKTVDPNELDNKYAYIQVTHVTPFFKEKELQRRLTDFEKNNNVNSFMYETPFTKVGKAHGEIHEQFKRRTVLLTSHSFPFVKKRIEVTNKTECILSPLEVAIDEMNAKVADLREVVDLAMPDMKKLQLKLQGCVSAQVHAGPIAYAEAFLSEEKVNKYPAERGETLKNIFRDFVNVCSDGLDLNAKLITTEQKEYHESLKSGFNEIVNQLSKMFGETILTKDMDGPQRGSMSVFNLVTTPGPGSSMA
ncbi:dedicator of cytokinesis protein 9-like isoform X5 [Mercenaria mercenaria]|uniref:dedicator of cytokinesis protein 9-like isoform X5 n=1 Tax=Mercenaria mercenaria TaxID=6596 RepID=UPI00234E5FF5|nr:dedicator of cytokinesis protein 9-like isoform X5 [Mercenaria mercenaria]